MLWITNGKKNQKILVMHNLSNGNGPESEIDFTANMFPLGLVGGGDGEGF